MDDEKVLEGPWKDKGSRQSSKHSAGDGSITYMLKGLLDSALIEPEDNMEQFAKLRERSERFEKMTGIQAWGHEIDELARLMMIAPIHYKKIKKVRNNKLYYSQLKRRLVLERYWVLDVVAASLMIVGALLLQWMFLELMDSRKVEWTYLKVAAVFALEGTVFLLVAMAFVNYINPLLIAKQIKPYLADMYPESD